MFVLNADLLMNILWLIILGITIGLSFALMVKSNKIAQLSTSVNNLKKALDEMDEQAKLVVRTDIELNKTQEELDKKLTGLYTLQRLARDISSTLEESQIFKKVNSDYLEDLSFKKAAAFLWSDADKIFSLHLNIGYPAKDAEAIRSFVDGEQDFFLEAIKSDKTLSSIDLLKNNQLKEKIKEVFKIGAFVISPVLPKEGNRGFLFVGAEESDLIITEGDEELITILANQLGQSLENARLFEKTWHAHQELENRVEQRTRELSLALEEVKKVSKRKSDFVSSVSHELRTPLTSIKGYASILLAGKLGAVPEEVQRRLEKINKHSDELVQFVNDLLDISRIESGKAAMKFLPLSLKTIVDEVSDLLSVQMKEKGIAFIQEIPADLPDIMMDNNQIKRVFINLINNAVKYTPQGKITVHARNLGQEIQVDISDTGCGMPADSLDKIFEEFYRVDSSQNQEIKGTGLGLSLVKNIIEAHKGRIWVKSRVGSGSTFSFALPIT